MIKYLENENIDDVINEKGIVILDFFASWCGPCKMLGPVLEEISSDRSGINVYKIDIDTNEEITRQFGVMSVPTLFIYKDGVKKDRTLGFLPKDVLIKRINKIDK